MSLPLNTYKSDYKFTDEALMLPAASKLPDNPENLIPSATLGRIIIENINLQITASILIISNRVISAVLPVKLNFYMATSEHYIYKWRERKPKRN